MELWDIYDENRTRTSKTMVRGEPIKDGDYHLVVHVCIFNSKGQMLIQKKTTVQVGLSRYVGRDCGRQRRQRRYLPYCGSA